MKFSLADRSLLRKTVFFITGLILLTGWVASFSSYKLFFSYITGDPLNFYGYSEWMINYAGGFVRRGLSGEILHSIIEFTGWDLYNVILSISYILYFTLLGILYYLFRKRKLTWWLLLSPILCGYVLDIVRKDFLTYILLIGIVWSLKKSFKNPSFLLLASIIGVIEVLIHEASFFYCCPLILLTVFYNVRQKSHVTLNLLSLFVVVLSLISVGVNSGNKETALSIIDSWNSILPGEPIEFVHSNNIGALTWNALETMKMHFVYNFNDTFYGWIVGISGRIFMWILAYYLVTNLFYVRNRTTFTECDRTNLSSLFLIVSFCILPLGTVLSCDTCRVFQYLGMGTLIPFLIFNKTELSRCLEFINPWSLKINSFIDRTTLRPRYLTVIPLLLLWGNIPWMSVFTSNWQWGPIGMAWRLLTNDL